ncbi:MAG: hypothetical protein WC455_11080 [Dehalococcoidia bacterium]|jgi:hypothetical protein
MTKSGVESWQDGLKTTAEECPDLEGVYVRALRTPSGQIVFVKKVTQDDHNDGGESYSIWEEHAQLLDLLRKFGAVWIDTKYHGYHHWKDTKSKMGIQSKLDSFRSGDDGHRFAVFYPGRGLTGQEFKRRCK